MITRKGNGTEHVESGSGLLGRGAMMNDLVKIGNSQSKSKGVELTLLYSHHNHKLKFKVRT